MKFGLGHNKLWLPVVLVLFAFAKAYPQGFHKDSIQIKVYTSYVKDRPLIRENIKVDTIFCDWCNQTQLDMVSHEAKYRTHNMSMESHHDPEELYRRITLVLRIARRDFNALGNEEENNDDNEN